MLTNSEQDAVTRARTLLDRTHYDRLEDADERIRDARAIATATLELADTLQAERSARTTLKQRCEEQQAILGRHAADGLT